MKSAINARLLTAAELIRQKAIFADIGTDHGYLPLFLLDEGRIEYAYCCDINEGPLASARKNAAERGRLDKCEFILTDGAAVMSGRGITDYAICGMGGELIVKILDAAPFVRDPDIRLILQPMTQVAFLRRYLAKNGFEIIDERLCPDEHRIYQIIACRYAALAPRELPLLAQLTGEKTVDSPFLPDLYAKIKQQYTDILQGKRIAGQSTDVEEKILWEIASHETH